MAPHEPAATVHLADRVAEISEYFGFAGKISRKSRFFHSFLPGCLGLAGGHEVPSGVADDVPGLRVRQVVGFAG
ncbi:hypothetical protein [Mobiluncus mulieris]|uniref:hypothetical protein n=1 Tax=Mobiluncus mulieris TaxID=2052 RepID=UPI00242E4A0C|nr:hypothetical protein [Mobiluncus mulieris]